MGILERCRILIVLALLSDYFILSRFHFLAFKLEIFKKRNRTHFYKLNVFQFILSVSAPEAFNINLHLRPNLQCLPMRLVSINLQSAEPFNINHP